MKRIALTLLVLAGCTPEQTPAETPAAPAVAEAPQTAAPASVALAADEIPAPAGEISVTSPESGARIASPLIAEGSAINSWFFEGQFRAKLEVNGATVAEAPAMQAGDKAWTDPGMIGFRAELPFRVTADTPAVLVLTEDMPQPKSPDSDEAGPGRTLRVPVVLTAAAQ